MSIYHKIYVQVFDQKGKRVDEISPNKLFIGLDVLREKWSAWKISPEDSLDLYKKQSTVSGWSSK